MILRRGSRGDAVFATTKLLAALGYLPAARKEFDAAVAMAVRAFQSQHLDPRGAPLVPDGIVGPLTLFALDAATGRRPDAEPSRPGLSDTAASGGGSVALAALEMALAEYRRGAGEAGGNNRGSDIRRYLDGRAPEGSDWCAGFVSHCFRAGAAALRQEMPFSYSVGARDIRNQLRNKGWEYKPTLAAPPQPGDIVTWWRGSQAGWQGHIGLVHSCADGVLTTIEGNRGAFPAKVGPFTYVLSRMERLLGFSRIPG